MKKLILAITVLALAVLIYILDLEKKPVTPRSLAEASDKVYITDQKGQKWDVTQARSLGFDPRGFQFGIGRNAIVPLGPDALKKPPESLEDSERVIGISRGDEAHAYRVRRLNMHEIANTRLGDTAIAAAY